MASGEGPFFSEHREVQHEMALMWKGRRTCNAHKGKLLLDDFNPVEFYDARNREDNRRGLINLLHSSND
jgi:hypothetical protein